MSETFLCAVKFRSTASPGGLKVEQVSACGQPRNISAALNRTLGTRSFSLAWGGNFRCWPKAEREKSSGTQGRVRIEEGDTYLPS